MTIQEIIERLCEYYGMNEEQLKSRILKVGGHFWVRVNYIIQGDIMSAFSEELETKYRGNKKKIYSVAYHEAKKVTNLWLPSKAPRSLFTS